MLKRVLPLAALVFAGGLAAQTSELAEPYKLTDGDNPIDVDIGHAAPFWYDFDGDGVNDLLVGQFGEGKLRFYKNHGTNEKPKFNGFEWVQAAGKDMRVPTG